MTRIKLHSNTYSHFDAFNRQTRPLFFIFFFEKKKKTYFQIIWPWGPPLLAASPQNHAPLVSDLAAVYYFGIPPPM